MILKNQKNNDDDDDDENKRIYSPSVDIKKSIFFRC